MSRQKCGDHWLLSIVLLRAAGEQEDFRPLFAHPKTGHLLGLGSPRTHLLGRCSPADRRICVSSLAGRAGDARRPVFLLLACCTQEDDEGGPTISELLQIGFGATENWNRQSDAIARRTGSCWPAAQAREDCSAPVAARSFAVAHSAAEAADSRSVAVADSPGADRAAGHTVDHIEARTVAVAAEAADSRSVAVADSPGADRAAGHTVDHIEARTVAAEAVRNDSAAEEDSWDPGHTHRDRRSRDPNNNRRNMDIHKRTDSRNSRRSRDSRIQNPTPRPPHP